MAISETELRALCADRISWSQTCDWSRREGKVLARKQERLGALVLDDRPWTDAPADTIARLFTDYARGETVATADVARGVIHIRAGAKAEEIPFTLSDFDRQLVEAGGWLEYADARY